MLRPEATKENQCIFDSRTNFICEMIRELKTLMAVAREGTFAAAGEQIGLTQAAVSAQMQRLEAGLGFGLLDRPGGSARLNAMGHQTLEQAQQLLALYSNLGSSNAGQRASVP